MVRFAADTTGRILEQGGGILRTRRPACSRKGHVLRSEFRQKQSAGLGRLRQRQAHEKTNQMNPRDNPIPSFDRGIVFECLGDSLVDHLKILLQVVPYISPDYGSPHRCLFRGVSQIHDQGGFLKLTGFIHTE
jgi:hypothetical protein